MDTKKTYIMHAKSSEEKMYWISAIEQVFIVITIIINVQIEKELKFAWW